MGVANFAHRKRKVLVKGFGGELCTKSIFRIRLHKIAAHCKIDVLFFAFGHVQHRIEYHKRLVVAKAIKLYHAIDGSVCLQAKMDISLCIGIIIFKN